MEVHDTTLHQRIEQILRPNLKFHEGDAPIPSDANLGALSLDSLASINLLFDLARINHQKAVELN